MITARALAPANAILFLAIPSILLILLHSTLAGVAAVWIPYSSSGA